MKQSQKKFHPAKKPLLRFAAKPLLRFATKPLLRFATKPLLRFAPTPNGFLHLGHAYSALLNHDIAKKMGGKLLLRFEDIDQTRCKPEFEHAILKDLEWLEIEWHNPIRRQSQHFQTYENILNKLQKNNLLYEAFLSRREIKNALKNKPKNWPHDPDGSPHYPGDEKKWRKEKIKQAKEKNKNYARRLNITKAQNKIGKNIFWQEQQKKIKADFAKWGDVILGRSDCPASYHLCAVIDDAACGINYIVRGQDLYESTHLHVLLQKLLKLPTPIYFHHKLIYNKQGKKLSKSKGDVRLKTWRDKGLNAQDIREKLGLIE